jgi:hypothetical protein
MSLLVIKLLSPNEVIHTPTGLTGPELLSTWKPVDSLFDIAPADSITFPSFTPLLTKYAGANEEVVITPVLTCSSEYREILEEMGEDTHSLCTQDTNHWTDHIGHFIRGFSPNLKYELASVGFMGCCRDWYDLNMGVEVDHELSSAMYLCDSFDGETDKVVVDISHSNPMHLHFYLWGLKQRLRGMTVEFVKVEHEGGKWEVIEQEDQFGHWETVFS